MARRSRLDEKGYYYHIICRGQRKNPLFFSPDDKKVFLKIINKILETHDLTIYAYCLMTNHVHLLVKRNEHPLHYFMKRLNTKYAIYFNKKYDLTGHVFQDRYKSFIVLDENYLKHLVIYFHLNPVKAGMCENPLNYEYSSALFYEKGNEKHIKEICSIEELNTKEKYIDFLNEDKQEFPLFKDTIGSKIKYMEHEKRHTGREKGKFKEKRCLPQKDEVKYAETILNNLGISLKAIKMSKYSRDDRKLILDTFIKLLEAGFNRSEIARLFELNKSTVGRILKKKY